MGLRIVLMIVSLVIALMFFVLSQLGFWWGYMESKELYQIDNRKELESIANYRLMCGIFFLLLSILFST